MLQISKCSLLPLKCCFKMRCPEFVMAIVSPYRTTCCPRTRATSSCLTWSRRWWSTTRPSASAWSRPWDTPSSPASTGAAPVARVAAQKIKSPKRLSTSDLWSLSGLGCRHDIHHGAQPLLVYSPREPPPIGLYQSPAPLRASPVFPHLTCQGVEFIFNLICSRRKFKVFSIYLPVALFASHCTL